MRIETLLLLCASATVVIPSWAASFVVDSGQVQTQTQVLTGNEQGQIRTDGRLLTNGQTAVRWSDAQQGMAQLQNAGLINASGDGRAIDTQGNNGSANLSFQLFNSGRINSGNDAVRLNFRNGFIGQFQLHNQGEIVATTGQVLDFVGLQRGYIQLTNQQRSQMQSSEQDAIRLGAVDMLTLQNAGLIQAEAAGRRALDIRANTQQQIQIHNQAGAGIFSSNDAIRLQGDIAIGQVSILNAGTIHTTGLGDDAGQAIDLNGLTGKGVRAVLQNFAGGSIRTEDADAVRIGGEGSIVNAGLIRAGGASDNGAGQNLSSDAIDFQQHGGQVDNQATGLIDGARHGITGDGVIVVKNATGGVIIGRNGAGVNLDGSGEVVNRGLIQGSVQASLSEGDGDGIDIDGYASIQNYGRIFASGANGERNGDLNRADGLAIGGGIVVNHQGGLILSQDRGILVDNSDGGAAFFATDLTNHGDIIATNEAVQLVGGWNDRLVNSGLILSRANTVAVDMGAGDDTVKLQTGTEIRGRLIGGAGYDQLTLTGANQGRFGLLEGFEDIQVQSGNWLMTADYQQDMFQQMTISSDSQLQIDGDAWFETLLTIDLISALSSPLLSVKQQLHFAEDAMLTVNFSNGWQSNSDGMLDLLVADAISGLSLKNLQFVGLAADYRVELVQSLREQRQFWSLRIASAAVSAPGSIGIVLLGLVAVLWCRGRRRHSYS